MSLTVTPSGSLDRDKATQIVDALAAPAPADKLTEWLTVCAVLTAQPRDDDMTSDLKLRVYAEKLAQWPGDVVRHVLDEWPSKSKWFPTWNEMEAALDRHNAHRPMVVQKVREVIGGAA